jgi:hypothetical protein
VLRRQSANSPLTNSAKESRVDNVANSEPLALRDGPWMDVGLLQKHIGYTLIPEVKGETISCSKVNQHGINS